EAGDIDQSNLPTTMVDAARSGLDESGQFNFGHTGMLTGAMFNFDNPPWRDKRVRQAFSMALDRDGFLSVTDQSGQGAWTSFSGPALTPFYLSPRDDAAEWGPSAKYFEYNIADAKALLSAAGYPDGLDVDIIANVDRYGDVYRQQWELIAASV